MLKSLGSMDLTVELQSSEVYTIYFTGVHDYCWQVVGCCINTLSQLQVSTIGHVQVG